MEIKPGMKFGLWTVIERAVAQGDNQGARWVCSCECGTRKMVRAVYLRSGRSTTCGCAGKLNPDKNIARFKSKIEIDEQTGCWMWCGDFTRGGYGSFFFLGKSERAHRAAYMIYRGEIADGLVVCHSCDTPACVNPEHLFVGTYQENTQDMWGKGRRERGNPKIRGTQNKGSKLTDEDVRKIRSLVEQGKTKAEVGRLFGIRDSHVCKIVQRKSWSHVD